MRQLKLTILLFTCLLLTAARCKKSGTPTDELSKLPPETQTGARTFGALVNGEAFIPSGSALAGPYLQCNYIYMNGGYYFLLMGSTNDSNHNVQRISLFTNSLAVKEGQILKLNSSTEIGKAGGERLLITGYGNENSYKTNANVTGELHITKLDEIKQIVSGTFFFDAINASGDKAHVTDGRFDMQYTQ